MAPAAASKRPSPGGEDGVKPPKKTPKKGAKAKAAPPPAPSVQGNNGGMLASHSPNAAAYDKLRRMVKELQENVDCFAQIHEEQPLAIGMGGREEPFSDSKYKAAFSTGDPSAEYKCGCNVLWMRLEEEAGQGNDVPLSEKGIKTLEDHFFAKPQNFKQEFIIAVKNGEAPDASKGGLMRVSPPEPLHACIRAAHRDWKAGKDNEVMDQWRKVFLSATFVFKVIESADDAHFENLQCRQDVHAAYQGMGYTLLQKIYDIVSFRTRKGGGLSAQQVADAYKASKVTFTGEAEDTSDQLRLPLHLRPKRSQSFAVVVFF